MVGDSYRPQVVVVNGCGCRVGSSTVGQIKMFNCNGTILGILIVVGFGTRQTVQTFVLFCFVFLSTLTDLV